MSYNIRFDDSEIRYFLNKRIIMHKTASLFLSDISCHHVLFGAHADFRPNVKYKFTCRHEEVARYCFNVSMFQCWVRTLENLQQFVNESSVITPAVPVKINVLLTGN